MKWYGEPERIDADQMLDCEACDKECADCSGQTVNGGFATPLCPEPRGFELDELINFATIAANAAGRQLDPEETDAEFNAVLLDLDANDASFLVDLMFYQLTGPLLGGAPKSSPAPPPRLMARCVRAMRPPVRTHRKCPTGSHGRDEPDERDGKVKMTHIREAEEDGDHQGPGGGDPEERAESDPRCSRGGPVQQGHQDRE